MSTAMKPILFSTPMVQAILDGRKTMTRRVAKGRNYKVDYVPETYNHLVKANVGDFYYFTKDKIRNGWGETINFYDAPSLEKLTYAMREHNDFPFNIGDVLWVRETWTYGRVVGESDEYGNSEFWLEQTQKEEDEKCIFYKADMDDAIREDISFEDVIWKPSIFMPKEACRIFLRVTNVRVERLQDMETSDMLKEGVSEYKNYEEFRNNHDPRNAKDFVQARDKIVNDWITLWNSINGKGAWEENPFVFVYEFQRIEKPKEMK